MSYARRCSRGRQTRCAFLRCYKFLTSQKVCLWLLQRAKHTFRSIGQEYKLLGFDDIRVAIID